jgi:prophage regulatory protein
MHNKGKQSMEKPNLRLIRLSEVQKAIPYSASHLWRLEQAGQFPKRVPIGPGRVGWVADEIQEWITSRIKARDSA